ncbi:MAG: hypothetical protein CME16_05685 [Gemmatimonadetes bacterium]|mgnify:CR=1 FL=1|nr:hypothetical protein [Gemmatimonadota bacterium]
MLCRHNYNRYLMWVVIITFSSSMPAAALDVMLDKWYVGIFTYGNFQLSDRNEMRHRDGLDLGETSIFTRGRLSSRVSLLSEHSLQPHHYREDQFKLERLVVRYEISENHWTEFGKLHTPANYWNDHYHHGRLFFPTVDRPLYFADNFFAIHDIGLRLGGSTVSQAFHYDLFLASGRHAVPSADGDQIFPDGIQSLNAAVSYLWQTWVFRTAIYIDGFRNASPLLRSHTFSVFMENRKIRYLSEFAANFVEAGKTGPQTRKISLYQSLIYKLHPRIHIVVGADYLSGNSEVDSDDGLLVGLVGATLVRNAQMTLKTQLERHNLGNRRHTRLVSQLAVGI